MWLNSLPNVRRHVYSGQQNMRVPWGQHLLLVVIPTAATLKEEVFCGLFCIFLTSNEVIPLSKQTDHLDDYFCLLQAACAPFKLLAIFCSDS